MSRKELVKLIWSFCLGDGALSSLDSYEYLGKQRRRLQSKYYIKQIEPHKDYIDYQANILETLTSVSIKLIPEYICKQNYVHKPKWELNTKTHPFYTMLRMRCYLNKQRVINPHDLKLLDYQCLSHLYMDQGWIEAEKRVSIETYIRVGLATHCYTYGDNLLLRDAISEKFNIEFNIYKHTQRNKNIFYYLRAKKDHAKRFLDGVSQYILPSYEYKLNYSNEQPQIILGDDIV